MKKPTSQPYSTEPYIGKNVTVGKGTVIQAFCNISDRVVIGRNCKIKPFVFIAEETVIGDNCFIGPGVKIFNDVKPPSHGKHWRPVHIGDNVSVGGGALIAPGVTIGDDAKIRMGAVVIEDVGEGEYRR